MQKRSLPPKEKVSKSKINGRMSLHLKNILEEDPLQTYSELSNKLKLECPDVSEAPGKHSVRRFMIKNGFNLSKKGPKTQEGFDWPDVWIMYIVISNQIFVKICQIVSQKDYPKLFEIKASKLLWWNWLSTYCYK